ncbi:peptide-N4-(N-acetyl-beta- glucosaminyl)asparagine amidase, partial [Mortierella sp. NVP85]
MSDLNEQQIQRIAEQVASQFVAMRLQRQRNREQASGSASHANTAPEANTRPSGEAKVTELAKELGDLFIQGTTSSAPIDAPTADPYASVPDPSVYEKDFVDVFEHVNLSVLAYEDPRLLDQARQQIPIDRLYEEAEAMAADYPDDSKADVVIRRLLHWFKNEYFTWVNEPPCITCQAKTTAIGHVAPTPQERLDGAGTVEAYRCPQGCTAITRFPRYGGMSKVLFSTRRGRCGEWAN